MLLHASGACLATISRLEERNDLPQDGDHWVKAWLEIEESSGTVPEFVYLVVQYGGSAPIEVIEELEGHPTVLRHDSLKTGERHWFVFSKDYDSAKFPPEVAGWWPYADGGVPRDVVEAVAADRFSSHPVWDKTLNVVYEAEEDPANETIRIRVREADTLETRGVLFDKVVQGQLKFLQLKHSPSLYEMEWPENETFNVVHAATVGDLPVENPFKVPAGKYRIHYAFELATGRQLAVWVARNREIWFMHAFQQYDRATGDVIVDMKFDLLKSGGIEAGGDTDNWYRRVVRKFESGRLISREVYRHEYIKTGEEPVYCSSGWIAVDSAGE